MVSKMVRAHIIQDSIKRDKTAKVLKVLGDPNRIKIIELLSQGEMCQCDIIPLISISATETA